MTTITVLETPFTANGFAFPNVPNNGNTTLVLPLPTNGTTTPAATLLRVTNFSGHIFVALGDESVTVAAGAAPVVVANVPRTFAIGSATYVAIALSTFGQNFMLETGN